MALHQMTKWMIQILESFQNPGTMWKLMITRRSKDPSVFEPVLVEAKRCAWTCALLYWKNQSLFVAPSDCEWSRNGRLNQDLLGTYSPLIKHEGLLVDLCSPLHILELIHQTIASTELAVISWWSMISSNQTLGACYILRWMGPGR